MTAKEYRYSKYDEVIKYLTPTPEEQTFLILQGKCPHNEGWSYGGHGHNDEWYVCVKCGIHKDY